MKWMLVVYGLQTFASGGNGTMAEIGRVPGWTSEKLCLQAAKDLIDNNVVNAYCYAYQETPVVLPQPR